MDDQEIEKLVKELEALGPQRVKRILMMSAYSSGLLAFSSINVGPFRKNFNDLEISIVNTWLKEKEREKELLLSEEANNIARKANQISWFAAAIAALSLILSIVAINT